MNASLYQAALSNEPPRMAAARDVAVRGAILSLDHIDRHHGDAWDECVADAAEPNPFAERWFVMASARHLSNPAAMLAAVVFRGDHLIALMPIERQPRYYRLPLPTLTNWVHANAFLGMPLLRRGEEVAACRTLLEMLDANPAGAPLLHLTGIVEQGAAHRALMSVADRPVATVLRYERALLKSSLSPTAYFEATVRKKKRKELKRLANRLAEYGPVTTSRLSAADPLDKWIDAFLTLEASGWKGREGSALGSDPARRRFFTEAMAGARARGRLEMLRMDVGGRPIAMLVNFLCPPGSASFKIAYDEAYARFSPGVLIQIDNYDILDHAQVRWMDSCAAANHPMIDSLWAERRAIVRLTLPLGGRRGRIVFAVARLVERAWAAIKARTNPQPPARNEPNDPVL